MDNASISAQVNAGFQGRATSYQGPSRYQGGFYGQVSDGQQPSSTDSTKLEDFAPTVEGSAAQAAKATQASDAAIREHVARNGQNDTSVYEKVAPHVTEATVIPTRHVIVKPVVEREVHQSHYHTSIQPIVVEEVLPEQHEHELQPVDHTEYKYGNEDAVKQKATDVSRFADKREEKETEHSQFEHPTVAAEHVHHHVFETIQPVIQKRTIVPKVVHVTVPKREVHHQEAKYHGETPLPPISMAEYQRLAGQGDRSFNFNGSPPTVPSTSSWKAANTASGTKAAFDRITGAIETTGNNDYGAQRRSSAPSRTGTMNFSKRASPNGPSSLSRQGSNFIRGNQGTNGGGDGQPGQDYSSPRSPKPITESAAYQRLENLTRASTNNSA